MLEEMRTAGQHAQVRYKSRQHQGGHKRFVLCKECNNTTGGWYGGDYAKFARRCAESATSNASGHAVWISLEGVRLLRVFKQALTIIAATMAPSFCEAFPAVRSLILNKDRIGRPDNLRLYCYLVAGSGGRSTGIMGVGGTGPFRLVAEFSWWPIGWVLAFEDQPIPELSDVTAWSTFDYNHKGGLFVALPCHSVATSIPLDYRTTAEVDSALAQNRSQAITR